MKTLYLIPLGIICILLSLVGCEKDTSAIGLVASDTVRIYDTIRVHDTIRIHDTVAPVPPTRLEVLTQKTWRMDFVHHVLSGVYSQYYLGGANTTGVNYDNLRFKFNTDGTGTHTDQYGNNYSLSWHFVGSDQRTLQVAVATGPTNTWQMLELAGNYLHGSAQLTISGNPNNIESFRLIQVP